MEPETYLEQHGHGGDHPHPTKEERPNQQNDKKPFVLRSEFVVVIILLIGSIASAAFLYVGISGVQADDKANFDRRSSEFIQEIVSTWQEYELSSLWIHDACRDRKITHEGFQEVYEHLKSNGLEFYAAAFMMNVTDNEREVYEAETARYLNLRSPDYNYSGFTGFYFGEDGVAIESSKTAPFYFPVHFFEPVENNEIVIDLDVYSSTKAFAPVQRALDNWKPDLWSRMRLLQDTDPSAYSVALVHPGIPLTGNPNLRPRDLAIMMIRVPDFLEHASRRQLSDMAVFIYDSKDNEQPEFLGGVEIRNSIERQLDFVTETELHTLTGNHVRIEEIEIAAGQWTVAILSIDDSFQSDKSFIILGGAGIFLACAILALGVYTNMRRVDKMAEIKTAAEAQKAEMAKNAVEAERQLNDYLAHEVRNPLSAAMSACHFVQTAMEDERLALVEDDACAGIQEDLGIIDSSLKFINEILRSLLDINRATSNKLKIECAPTDLLQDVFNPVDAMLYRRGNSNVKTTVDCPPNLIVLADSLRLKQIVLNLGRNASKFTETGFIKLCGNVVAGSVQISVEDSGKGIPVEKRDKIFQKFQESLDSLSQGTGVGLSLCQELTRQMGASIFLDEQYDSGINGYPGARFVVDLNVPPMDFDDKTLDAHSGVISDTDKTASDVTNEDIALPENLRVLFVDDDFILRKLFIRSVRKIAPSWTIEEASNGESALRLTDNNSYDLIFMDQYMSSTEKQLLGTETCRLLRTKGVKSKICGLSANYITQEFFNAGADSFLLKPFPCEEHLLRKELNRALFVESSGPVLQSTSVVDA